MDDRDVTIELSEEAAKWLVAHGYDEQMGARPMARPALFIKDDRHPVMHPATKKAVRALS
jgi:hypothetical protein